MIKYSINRFVNSIWLDILIVGFYFCLWSFLGSNELSIRSTFWFLSLAMMSFFYGFNLYNVVLGVKNDFISIPGLFLSGFIALNLVIFLFLVIFPLKLEVIWIVLFVISLIYFFFKKELFLNFEFKENSEKRLESVSLFLLLLFVTIWCREILKLPVVSSNDVSINVWPDVYYHISMISSFAKAQGIYSVSDIHMAGSVMQPYHILSYIIPSAFVSFSGVNVLLSYSSVFVPLGLFLMGLAAYQLCSHFFEKKYAFGAVLFLFLLPDSYQQGFGNNFFSFHWLQQVAPGQGYGVACGALGISLMYYARRQRAMSLFAWGYFFAFCTLLYKAQIFVALSFLAFMFPLLFSFNLKKLLQVSLCVIFILFYVCTIFVSQRLPWVPKIWLDGSGLYTYSNLVLSLQEPGYLRDLFLKLFAYSENVWGLRAVFFAAFLSLITFGFFLFLFFFLLVFIRKKVDSASWYLPIIAFIIYIIMSVGLAMDVNRVGGGEELMHRPFVWAYFVVVVWTGGGIFYLLDSKYNKSTKLKKSFLLLSLILIIVPIIFSRNIQAFKVWGVGPQKIPLCLFKMTEYVKFNSNQDAIIQDSLNDSLFKITGLSERSSFLADASGYRLPSDSSKRMEDLLIIKKNKDFQEVIRIMKQKRIFYYTVTPSDTVAWEEEGRQNLVYNCQGYKVYRF